MLQNIAKSTTKSKDTIVAHLTDFGVDVVVAHLVEESVTVVIKTARIADQHVTELRVGLLDDALVSDNVEGAEEVSFSEGSSWCRSWSDPQLNVAGREVGVAHVAANGATKGDFILHTSVVSAVEDLGEAFGGSSGIGGECSVGIFAEIAHTGVTRMLSKSDVSVDFGVEDQFV